MTPHFLRANDSAQTTFPGKRWVPPGGPPVVVVDPDDVTTINFRADHVTPSPKAWRSLGPEKTRFVLGFSAVLLLLVPSISFASPTSITSAGDVVSQPDVKTSPASAEPIGGTTDKKNILLLYDERPSLPGLKLIDQAVERELESKFGRQIELYRECLDLSRLGINDDAEFQRNYYHNKYGRKKISAVLAIMEPSLDFMLKHGNDVFPDVPVVFCGVDEHRLAGRSFPSNVTGVLVRRDFAKTVDLILRVLPQTGQIVFISGSSSYDRALTELAKADLRMFGDRLPIEYLTDAPLPKILQRVSNLPAGSVVFYSTVFVDGDGNSFDPYEVASLISARASVPTFSLSERCIGRGIVGGCMSSFTEQGSRAADIVAQILNGKRAADIAIAKAGAPIATFDWRQIERWKINPALLPTDSVVRFHQPSLWERHKWTLLAIASVIGLQSAAIIGLIFNRRWRRRAEAELGESEVRFRNAADSAPVMIWMSGPDKLCTLFNKAWLAFTGRTIEQELGNGWSSGVHLDDLAKCLEDYVTAFDAHQPFTIQYRLRRFDGEYRSITDQGVPRYDAQRNFLGYIGACVDITDLLEQQKALHEFEERVTLAAEAAHLGVWELNTKTGELWMSDKARELFQFGRDTRVSYKDFQDRIRPEDRALRDSAVQEAIKTQGGYDVEYRTLLPDGTVRWIGGRARCVGDEDGALTRLLGVSMDVTARKQAQELFELATEASPSGTLLVDDNGQIVLVNAHVEELFGYERDELIGKPVETFLPEHRGDRGKFMAAPEAQEMGVGRELFGRRKDGTEFPVEIGLNPIQTPQGRLVLASVVDISARKAAEAEARRQRDQINLLTRVSLLGEMTASLAHELNQPLSAIVSNASVGMRFMDKGKADPETLREILVDVVADALRASEIIRNVRNTVKKGDEIRQLVSLNDVVASVARMVRSDAAAHSCEVKVSLANNLPAVVADPTQIQQVLINLVGNAFEAMRDKPVDKRRVELTTEKNGDETIYVAVRDYGVGISEAARSRLFEQFFTTKKEGLGMGLAIVRSVIEAHGGTIEAENVKGGGARFHFALPVSKEAPK